MLSKEYRIPKQQIPFVVRKGRRSYNNLFTLVTLTDSKLSNPKITIVVSKKIDKRAAVRNRIKRRVRACLYAYIKENKMTPKYYVFLCKDIKIKDIEFDALYQSISSMLQKAS